MEEVLVGSNRGCVIESSGHGLYELILLQDGQQVEMVRNVQFKSAARIAADWLDGESED